jgi:hypothetical protein
MKDIKEYCSDKWFSIDREHFLVQLDKTKNFDINLLLDSNKCCFTYYLQKKC